MNDYVAAYHDAVLLVGQVMRDIVRNNQSHGQEMDYVNVNYFRNISFNGRGMDEDSLSCCASRTQGGVPAVARWRLCTPTLLSFDGLLSHE